MSSGSFVGYVVSSCFSVKMCVTSFFHLLCPGILEYAWKEHDQVPPCLGYHLPPLVSWLCLSSAPPMFSWGPVVSHVMELDAILQWTERDESSNWEYNTNSKRLIYLHMESSVATELGLALSIFLLLNFFLLVNDPCNGLLRMANLSPLFGELESHGSWK